MEKSTYNLDKYILCFSIFSDSEPDDEKIHFTKNVLDDYLGINGSFCFSKGETNLFSLPGPKPVKAAYSFWTKVIKLSNNDIEENEISDGQEYLNLVFEKFKDWVHTYNLTKEKVDYIEESFKTQCVVQLYSYGKVKPTYILLKEHIQLISSINTGLDIFAISQGSSFLLK